MLTDADGEVLGADQWYSHMHREVLDTLPSHIPDRPQAPNVPPSTTLHADLLLMHLRSLS